MDYLQYFSYEMFHTGQGFDSFKPYYKWITFNTISQNYSKAKSAYEF